MRLPQFTTRRLMVLVAVVAVATGTAVGLVQRRDSFLDEAAGHRELSDEALQYAYVMNFRYTFGLSEPERAEQKAHERLGIYHAEMRAKYERAARYPWLPVTADPLEPE